MNLRAMYTESERELSKFAVSAPSPAARVFLNLNPTFRTKDAIMSAKDATMSAKDATISAQNATMSAYPLC